MKKYLRLFGAGMLLLSFISLADYSFAQEKVYWDLEEFLEGSMDAYFNAKYDKAIDLGNDSLSIIEKKFGPDHPNAAAVLVNLATFYKIEKKYSQAEKLYKRALSIYEGAFGLDNTYTAKVWDAMGDNYTARRRFKEAEESYNNSRQIWNKNLGNNSPNEIIVSSHLGALYKDKRQYKEAEDALSSAVQSIIAAYGEGNPVLIRPLYDMGKLFEAQSKDAEAEQYYRYAWGIFKGNFYIDDPSIEKALYRIKSEVDKAWAQRSEPIYKRLTDVSDLYIGTWHPDAPGILDILPSFYLKQVRYSEAEHIYEDSLEIMLSNLGSNHLNVAKVLDNMAGFYRKMGKPEKASEASEKARLIRQKDRF